MAMLLRVRDDRHLRDRSEVRDLERWLHREFPAFDLFVYLHARNGNYTITEWISRDKRRASELVVLGPTPKFTSEAQRDQLRQMLLRPTRGIDIIKSMAEDERERDRTEAELKAEQAYLMAKATRDGTHGAQEHPQVSMTGARG